MRAGGLRSCILLCFHSWPERKKEEEEKQYETQTTRSYELNRNSDDNNDTGRNEEKPLEVGAFFFVSK